SDLANTYFLPSGMQFTTTACCPGGLGDYSIQDAHSLDETQADYLGGVGTGCGSGLSEFGGFASGGSGPLQEAVTEIMEGTWDFDTAITNALADSGLGAGFERSWGGGGGATNALNVPLSLGGAVLIAAEHRNEVACPAGSLVFGALSWTGEGGGVLPSPGIPVFGTWLLISPTGVAYATTLGTWIAAGVICSGGGDLSVAPIAIPAVAVGTDLGLQTGVMLSATLYDSGNAVLIKLR
ncbi:MAG: hypothetical protein O7B99_08960, partial [Planctomycetota bacterium]|nr:hypothetical protein [Planctomycetota bacterium]